MVRSAVILQRIVVIWWRSVVICLRSVVICPSSVVILRRSTVIFREARLYDEILLLANVFRPQHPRAPHAICLDKHRRKE